MENREQQILSEIKVMMGSIRSQLELLDAKMAELQQCVDPEDFDNNPIELDIDMTEEEVVDDLPLVEDLPLDDAETVSDSEIEEEVEPEPDPEPEPEPEPDLESDPEPDPEPEPEPEPEPVVPLYEAAQALEEYPWRTDMPGSPVKDVRSAISLNDRIIFINYLFDEDPLAFQNAITVINSMDTLAQVEEYLRSERPAWNFSSELVYRFMMAVRRRVK